MMSSVKIAFVVALCSIANAGLSSAIAHPRAHPKMQVVHRPAAPVGHHGNRFLPAVLPRRVQMQNHRDFSCPAAVGTYPHEEFCNLFYECHNYEAYLFACPFDWLFESFLRLCDFPKNVNCNGLPISTPGPDPGPTTESMSSLSTTTPSTTTRSTSTEHTTTPTTVTTTLPSTTLGPFECPPEDGVYPNPASCSSFYQCVFGTAYLTECPSGTNFDPATLQCENGDDFCNTQERELQFVVDKDEINTDPNTDPTTITTGPISTSTRAPDPTPSTWFECPKPEGNFVSPYNCSVYFICTNGLAWQEICPAGLWFDVALGYCNYQQQVNCEAHPTEAIRPGPASHLIPAEKIGEDDESISETDTTLVFETTIGRTTENSLVTTQNSTSEPPVTPVNWFVCSGDGNFANPYDCNSYLECIFGNAWLLQCPADYVFDQTTGTCKPPGQVECKESSAEPTVKPTEPTFTVEPDFVCPADGLYPYEPSCHYYYQCANSFPYLIPCSANLIFDPKKKRCVNVEEADLDSLTCQLAHLSKNKPHVSQLLKMLRRLRVPKASRDGKNRHESFYHVLHRAAANHGGPQTRNRQF